MHYYKLDALNAGTARQSLPRHSLTGCMEQNAPSEKLIVVQLVKKKESRVSRNPNVHYPVQNNPILVPVLSQLNPLLYLTLFLLSSILLPSLMVFQLMLDINHVYINSFTKSESKKQFVVYA